MGCRALILINEDGYRYSTFAISEYFQNNELLATLVDYRDDTEISVVFQTVDSESSDNTGFKHTTFFLSEFDDKDQVYIQNHIHDYFVKKISK